MVSFPTIKRYLSSLSRKSVLITFHSIGDLDAVAGAFALSRCLPRATIAMPDHLNAEAKKFCVANDFSPAKFSEVKDTDFAATILIDCSSANLAPHMATRKIDLLIDHHTMHSDKLSAKLELIDETAAAVCELLYFVLPKIDAKSAHALAAGIISDSANFSSANPRTFEVMGKLLAAAKMPYDRLLYENFVPPQYSQRLELLKSCQNLRFNTQGEYIVASSVVNSFEAHVAMAFINLGADVAFVGHKGKLTARISGRCRRGMPEGFSVAPILKEIAPLINGTGGGHPHAAGATGTNPDAVEDALGVCVTMACKKIGEIQKGRIKNIEW